MDDDALLALLAEIADAVSDALKGVDDWGPSGLREGQYAADLVADAAALEVLAGLPVGVLSEESGTRDLDADVVIVIDPLDGSTNASHGIPHYATSLCAVSGGRARVALVADQAKQEHFAAIAGRGAWLDGERIRPSDVTSLGEAIVGLSGYPDHHLGWQQFRGFGAGAIDLCWVACGRLDAYLDASPGGWHGPWDYLGGMLVCTEAGAVARDLHDRELVVLDHDARRAPMAAATARLADALAASALHRG